MSSNRLICISRALLAALKDYQTLGRAGCPNAWIAYILGFEFHRRRRRLTVGPYASVFVGLDVRLSWLLTLNASQMTLNNWRLKGPRAVVLTKVPGRGPTPVCINWGD